MRRLQSFKNNLRSQAHDQKLLLKVQADRHPPVFTTSLRLEEFFSDDIPNYAIISHRWESEEVTFQDLYIGHGVNIAGYSKITGCYRQAALDGWQYAWVDSCCIDKSSSAELSEAINSMFGWHRNAQV